MLQVANQKINKLWIEKDFNFKVWNIEKLDNYSDNFYDYAISFYNVLSFVNNS